MKLKTYKIPSSFVSIQKSLDLWFPKRTTGPQIMTLVYKRQQQILTIIQTVSKPRKRRLYTFTLVNLESLNSEMISSHTRLNSNAETLLPFSSNEFKIEIDTKTIIKYGCRRSVLCLIFFNGTSRQETKT